MSTKTRPVVLALTVLATAALVASAADARPTRDGGLKVRFGLPLTFPAPTRDCPSGPVEFGISVNGKSGSGSLCAPDVVPVDCPPTPAALFCDRADHVSLTLRLPGGRIEADATAYEVIRCNDPNCNTVALDQRWSGRVTRARGTFSDLERASVSGGGTAVLDGATGEPLSLDEVLVIGHGEDEDDDGPERRTSDE